MELPYDPVIPFLGIYPKECKAGYKRDTATPMFMATLFTIARCNILQTHTHTMELYSAIRKNETMWFEVNECHWRISS
jgi:hypothetical protein